MLLITKYLRDNITGFTSDMYHRKWDNNWYWIKRLYKAYSLSFAMVYSHLVNLWSFIHIIN